MPEVFNEILGKKIIVPDSPERIVSLSPALTETVFMLGLGDSVAAVSAFCVRPEEARKKRKVGSYSSVNNDLLKSINPDLILTITGYQRELAMRLSENYPVYVFELPVSIFGIIDTVVKLGLILGREREARGIASDLLASLKEVGRCVGKRVYVEIDLGGPVTFGSYSYITDALELIGCENIFGNERCEWLAPDLDKVKKEKPDVFIYEAKMYTNFSDEMLEKLILKRGWGELDFYKKRRFFLTPGPYDFLAHHGPSFITQAIPWLSEKICGKGSELRGAR